MSEPSVPPETPAPDELEPASARGGGLRQVTIAPASTYSMPDFDPASASGAHRARDPYLGATIDGRYKVEALLGEGGMGVVYRCTHKIIGKKVAMKVLRADMARDVEVTERFLNEARAASAIGNPHIIDISDFGQLPDGSTYFVMEFLDGQALTKLTEKGEPVPLKRLESIARQMAEGLAAAHDAGIVHRDLKPDNVFLVSRGAEKDFVKILDFGIAKVSSSGDKLTRAGQVFGTPHYMSPEQAAGAPIDHRCDIYAFGVMLYELSSGKLPFDADNFMGILTQHMYKAPVPMRALVPAPQDIPAGLEAIVLKCLSKRPEQRYQDMRELVTDLDRLRDGLVPTAVNEMMERSGGFNVPADYFKKGMPAPVPATPAGPEKGMRWPLVAGVTGVVAAVGIVVAIFAKSSSSDAKPTSVGVAPSSTPATAQKPSEPSVAPAPSPASTAATKPVAIAVVPADAHVFVGETDLGSSPVVVQVPETGSLAVDVRREGYRSLTLSVDATQSKRNVKLEREVVASGARPAAPKPGARPEPTDTKPRPTESKPKPKPHLGGGDIENPWGN